MSEQQIPETADKGLEGVVAFTSEISAIVDATLTYCGYTIEDLAENSSFEEVVFLLWNRRLPTAQELDTFQKDIGANMELPGMLVDMMKKFPKTTTPMEVIRSAVSILSLTDSNANDISDDTLREQAVRLTAKMPALVTAWHRIRNDWDLVQPDTGKSMAYNFFYTMNGQAPESRFVETFDTALILHADHTMNASTFSARVTTATQSDVYSAITTAVGTLKGPLHGGANEQVMRMLERIGSLEKVESWLHDALERKEKIMGFGHRVYKNGDPRAKILKKMSEEICQAAGKSHLYEMSAKINEIMEKEKGLLPNVDFYSASLYHSLGIPTDLFTPVFASSRISGWLAHIMEQRRKNRLIRPRSVYVGETGRQWKPVAER